MTRARRISDAWYLASARKTFDDSYLGEPNSGCWLWTGTLNWGGYGQMTFRARHMAAHRFSYELHHGPIPKGLWVLHKCDVSACVNPRHLYLGTHEDNMRDAFARGRLQRTLSDSDVVAIRSDGRPQPAIARAYGVSQSLISRIKSGQKRAKFLEATP